MFEFIKSYPDYNLGWYVKGRTRLYKTTQRKERTEEQNNAIIASQTKIVKVEMEQDAYNRNKTTPEQVVIIKRMIAEGSKNADISRALEVTSGVVSNIRHGKTHTSK